MRGFVERAGDRLAAGLRRVWNNLFVLWLGSMVGAWSARMGVLWQFLGSALLLAVGVAFVRWWEMRRLTRDFLAAAESRRLGLIVLPSGQGGEQR